MSTKLTRSLHRLQLCEQTLTRPCLHHRARIIPKRLRLPLQTRPFSSASPWQASSQGRAIRPSGQKKSAPSMAVSMAQQRQKQLQEGGLPNDVGLLPDTFIMPRGANRPSWFGAFGSRWKLEKKRARLRLTEFFSAMTYRFILIRPRPRLHLRTIPGVAKDLQEKILTHFASGDLPPIEDKVCSGMLASLRARLGQRALNTSLRWTRHKFLSRPKLMSYKAAVMPGRKGEAATERSAMVQAVVRLHTLQSLQHMKRVSARDAQGKLFVKEVVVDAQEREVGAVDAVAPTEGAKESVEYLVVQKMVRKGREGEWMVWGTAEETTIETIRRAEKKMAQNRRQNLLAKTAA